METREFGRWIGDERMNHLLCRYPFACGFDHRQITRVTIQQVIRNRFSKAIKLNAHPHLVAILQLLVIEPEIKSIAFQQLKLKAIAIAQHPNDAVAIACG